MKALALATALSMIVSLGASAQSGSVSFSGALKKQPSEAAAPVDVAAIQKRIDELSVEIKNDPKNDRHYGARGQNLSKLGRYEDAVKDLSEAISLNPTRQAYYICRGLYLLNLKKNRASLSDFDKAIEIGPTSWDLYQKRGTSKAVLDDHEGAILDAEQALKLQPNQCECLTLLAGEEGALGRGKQAVKHYTDAIAIKPGDPVLYQLRGYVFEKMGQKSQAQQDFAKAKQLGFRPYSGH